MQGRSAGSHDVTGISQAMTWGWDPQDPGGRRRRLPSLPPGSLQLSGWWRRDRSAKENGETWGVKPGGDQEKALSGKASEQCLKC